MYDGEVVMMVESIVVQLVLYRVIRRRYRVTNETGVKLERFRVGSNNPVTVEVYANESASLTFVQPAQNCH